MATPRDGAGRKSPRPAASSCHSIRPQPECDVASLSYCRPRAAVISIRPRAVADAQELGEGTWPSARASGASAQKSSAAQVQRAMPGNILLMRIIVAPPKQMGCWESPGAR